MTTSLTISYTTKPRPAVKWAGGKTSLLPELLKRVPAKFGTYYEPFVGGGAFFFALYSEERIKKAVLNDSSKLLMKTYAGIKQSPEEVIWRLRKMPNSLNFFLKTRKMEMPGMMNDEIAAWFIYLNKTAFNGLWRTNKKGEFNVPFGRYPKPKICDAPNLRAVSMALRGVKLKSEDFMYVTTDAKAGDFVYFDPPYMPRAGNEFVAYGPTHFGLKDHERLRNTALSLKERGVRVMISNSGADKIRELYKRGFKVEEVRGARSIAADGARRVHMPDLLIT